MSQEPAHAKLAPSAAHRWLNCPGCVNFCDGMPDDSGDAAKHGTFAHQVAEACLDENVDAADMVGHKAEVEGKEFELSSEDADHVQSYLDVVRFLADCAESADALYVERKVKWFASNDVKGTADAVVLWPDHMHVVDLKFGAGVFVEVDKNPQLMTYAVCACYTLFGADKTEWPSKVSIHVVQPRHWKNGDGDGHRTSTMDVDALIEWERDVLVPGAAATAADTAPLRAGEWCKWCPGAASCPSLRETSLAVAQDAFEDIAAPGAPPAPETMTPEQLGQALDLFPLVREWMKAVEAHAEKRANSGEPPVGYKVVQATGNRTWKGEERDVAELISMTGADPFTRKLISPAKAEKILGRKAVAQLAYKPTRGTVLVPESDKRPAYNPAAAFNDVN